MKAISSRSRRSILPRILRSLTKTPHHAPEQSLLTLRPSAMRMSTTSSSSSADGFRPRRMSRYGLDRFQSRALPPRGPLDPNSFDTRRKPIVLDDDDDDEDLGEYEGILPPSKSGSRAYYNASFDPDLTEREIGHAAASAIRHTLRERSVSPPSVETMLRDVNYLVAPRGSTEDSIGARRALMEMETEEERREFERTLDRLIEDEQVKSYGLGEDELPEIAEDDEKHQDEEERELELVKDYDIKPHHNWCVTLCRSIPVSLFLRCVLCYTHVFSLFYVCLRSLQERNRDSRRSSPKSHTRWNHGPIPLPRCRLVVRSFTAFCLASPVAENTLRFFFNSIR